MPKICLTLLPLEICGIINILGEIYHSNYSLEFEKVTSIPLDTLHELIDRMNAVSEHIQLEDYTTTTRIEFEPNELWIIERALQWAYRKVDDWEFPILMAITKEEMKEVQKKKFGRIVSD